MLCKIFEAENNDLWNFTLKNFKGYEIAIIRSENLSIKNLPLLAGCPLVREMSGKFVFFLQGQGN